MTKLMTSSDCVQRRMVEFTNNQDFLSSFVISTTDQKTLLEMDLNKPKNTMTIIYILKIYNIL